MAMIALVLSFSVAEWGVLDARASKVISSPPKQTDQTPKPIPKPVRAPVIYFYGKVPDDLVLSLGVSPGRVIASEPGFTEINGKPSWKIKPGNEKNGKRAAVLPCWTDPEATAILANGRACDYIFYEAMVSFNQGQSVKVLERDEKSVKIVNVSRHPVYDVLYVVYTEKDKVVAAYTASLGSEDTVRLDFRNLPSENEVMARLKGLGFTKGAAKAFYDEWWPVLTKRPGSPPTGSLPRVISLSYRLSRNEIDEILPVSMSPEPEKVIRAWWVLAR